MEILFFIAFALSLLNVICAFVTKEIFFAGGWISYHENKSHFFAGLVTFIMFIFFYGGFYFFIFPSV
ncbi:hypothetical protein [Salinivibrio proteolyticus]|uniref:Cytochrome b561 domain-containing protein n=1 Tax=Salinivibrio proteolyticus TaxID=334715 RepID=A0ABY7L9U6_9GAMM|nr:hypothetical protein [Salinivibrio proteolyticus]WBA14028.1 hypothetical protein N7E60_09885 [Salinivibrio proteolyticus]